MKSECQTNEYFIHKSLLALTQLRNCICYACVIAYPTQRIQRNRIIIIKRYNNFNDFQTIWLEWISDWWAKVSKFWNSTWEPLISTVPYIVHSRVVRGFRSIQEDNKIESRCWCSRKQLITLSVVSVPRTLANIILLFSIGATLIVFVISLKLN